LFETAAGNGSLRFYGMPYPVQSMDCKRLDFPCNYTRFAEETHPLAARLLASPQSSPSGVSLQHAAGSTAMRKRTAKRSFCDTLRAAACRLSMEAVGEMVRLRESGGWYGNGAAAPVGLNLFFVEAV